MASTNAHTQPAAAQRSSYRRMARWLGLGALGMGAWILLSVMTALLDFRAEGAGLIGAFDSLSAFLATGAALTVVPLTAYGIHRHGFGRRAAISAAALLAAFFLVLAVATIGVVFPVIACVSAIAVGAYLLRDSVVATNANEDTHICGWRNDGPFGPGYYAGDMLLDDDDV